MRKLRKLRPLKKRERPFEYRLRDELKKRGVMFIKTKPTITGFPDRLAVGHGATKLVELKREGEDLDDVQTLVHRDLKRRGVSPLVVYGPNVREAANEIEQALAFERMR